ncbi:MAG: hypothetical protein DMF88_03595 [Acidobacteria bacterium]|nr:MAG: hypothetical protein DMF88_03595 [Acidobacteriota bacterium]
MSCCGGKREQLARERRVQERAAVETEPAPQPAGRARNPRTFEYVGHGSVSVRGAVSGTMYRFARRGDRVEIAGADVLGMMGERDIRPAAGA